MDQDGTLTIQDAFQILMMALEIQGLPDTFQLAAGDVAPPGDPDNFIIPGDGVLDLADATRVFRRAAGLDQTPDWPDL